MVTLTLQHFCYWLQGAIEIGGLETLDYHEAKLIRERACQVENPNYFTLGVRTILEFYPYDKGFPAITEELQKMFEHVIDLSYEGDRADFLDVHEGKVAVP